uniref:Uncharacterized protein n=1 Tax=Nymphaea colorata TaxID=210225 RepID=A0A5K1CQ57_9MAGN
MRVRRLVRVQRPSCQRHTQAQALHARVPPTVAKEPTHRTMAQYLKLRNPASHHEARPGDSLLEPLRQADLRIGSLLKNVPPVRGSKHPQEPLTAALKAGG